MDMAYEQLKDEESGESGLPGFVLKAPRPQTWSLPLNMMPGRGTSLTTSSSEGVRNL